MGNSEFDDVAAHLLEPEESLDSEQTGIDLDEGYSPPESPRELGDWGLTASEARTHESLARRLAREVPDVTDRWDGDGIGDSADSDGEPIDDQVGDSRAGRLVAFGVDPTDPTTDYRAHDVGIDGGAASAEEAAMHIIADEDTMARDQLQSVAQIREIMEGETAQAAEAMLLLRPRWKTADAVIDFIDTKLRPTGYRLVGAFEHSSDAAVSIVGFRELWSTACGVLHVHRRCEHTGDSTWQRICRRTHAVGNR